MMKKTFIYKITLYNRYTDKSSGKSVILWKKRVLENCYFSVKNIKKLNSGSLSDHDSYIVRIPESDDYTKSYNGEDGKFTLNPGDIIVLGEVADEMMDEAGKRPSDILKRYEGSAFTIGAVFFNTLLKNARHYRVSGV